MNDNDVFDVNLYKDKRFRIGRTAVLKDDIKSTADRVIDIGDYDDFKFSSSLKVSPSLRSMTLKKVIDRFAKMKELQYLGYRTLINRGFTPNELVMLGRYGEDLIMPAYNLETSNRDYSRELGVVVDADTSQARGALLGLTELMCNTISDLGLTPVYKLCWQRGSLNEQKSIVEHSTPYWIPILVSGRLNTGEVSSIIKTKESEDFRLALSSIFWPALFNYVKFCSCLGIHNPISSMISKARIDPQSSERFEIDSLVNESLFKIDQNSTDNVKAIENLGIGCYAMGATKATLHRDLCTICVPTLNPTSKSAFVLAQHSNDASKDRISRSPDFVSTAIFDLRSLHQIENDSREYLKDGSTYKTFGLSRSQLGVLSSLLDLCDSESITNIDITNRADICVCSDIYDKCFKDVSFTRDSDKGLVGVNLIWNTKFAPSNYAIQNRVKKSKGKNQVSYWSVNESSLMTRAFTPSRPWLAPNANFYAASPYALSSIYDALRNSVYSKDVGLSETLSKCVRLVQDHTTVPRNLDQVMRLLR